MSTREAGWENFLTWIETEMKKIKIAIVLMLAGFALGMLEGYIRVLVTVVVDCILLSVIAVAVYSLLTLIVSRKLGFDRKILVSAFFSYISAWFFGFTISYILFEWPMP